MPQLFLIIFVGWMIYHIITQSWVKKIIFLLILIVYLSVFVELNGNVRKASTHGNTKHGWYSKYNTAEKTIAIAWIFGFPILCFSVNTFFSSTTKKESEKITESIIDTQEENTETRYSKSQNIKGDSAFQRSPDQLFVKSNKRTRAIKDKLVKNQKLYF